MNICILFEIIITNYYIKTIYKWKSVVLKIVYCVYFIVI